MYCIKISLELIYDVLKHSCCTYTPRVLQAQKRAYFVAQDAVRREDEMSKRVSRINEEGEEEYWDEQVDAVDNVSIISFKMCV